MVTTPRSRAAGVVLLLGVLFVLAVWYGSLPPDPSVGAHPDADDLAEDYGMYLGERVQVEGEVIAVDPVVLESAIGVGEPMRFEIVEFDRGANRGDYLRVVGTAREGHVIAAEKVLSVPEWGFQYMYVVSALAGIWVLGRIVRGWRWDSERMGLAPRRGDQGASESRRQDA